MQLSIFGPRDIKSPDDIKSEWHIFVDGASRNNPGKAAAGIYIRKNDIDYIKKGFFLNIKTNNEAEYLALVIALLLIQDELHNNDTLHIVSDSQLLINQLNGSYAVKKPELKKLYNVIKTFLIRYNHQLRHVLREHNKIADELANHAIDQKKLIPNELLEKLHYYEINI